MFTFKPLHLYQKSQLKRVTYVYFIVSNGCLKTHTRTPFYEDSLLQVPSHNK